MLAVVATGASLRIAPVAANGFPLNDGGLFVAMIQTILDKGPQLPPTVTYNGITIPFAYPPLGFYLAAGFRSLTGVSMTTTLQILPVAFAVATIPVAYLLFRRLFDSEFRALVATAAFAVIPRTYNWMIDGGGVTRALGLLAALGTVVVAIDLYREGGKRHHVATGVLLGITALSHPQAGVFAGTSLVVLIPAYAPTLRIGLARFLAATAIGAVVIAPWLITVLIRDGFATLLGAAQSGGSVVDSLGSIASLRLSDGLFEVLGIVGAFGFFVALINRRWLLPGWFVVTILVSSRAGLTFGSIMLSGAVAYGLADGIRLLGSREPRLLVDLRHRPVALALVVAIGVAALTDSAASGLRPLSPLHGMDADTRAALAWIKDETAPSSVILVASGTGWFIDATSEWLPVLTGRRSSATVQGTEWLGPVCSTEHEAQYIWLQTCAAESRDDCVQQWENVIEHVDYVLAERSGVAPAYGHGCCLAFADELRAQGASVTFANGSAVILDTSTMAVALADAR